MLKIITVISLPFAIASLVYSSTLDISKSFILGISSLALILLCFWIEKVINTNGNDTLNRFCYFFTKSNKKFDYHSKHLTYTVMQNHEYKFEKKYKIIPRCKSLDSMDDKFMWSAPSKNAKVTPLYHNHEINCLNKKRFWTHFPIYFNETCTKNRQYEAGVIISNLKDPDGESGSFLSTTIDRKTNNITLVVKFSIEKHPSFAKFRIFSSVDSAEDIFSEGLQYDTSVGGFLKHIPYPRKGWTYSIDYSEIE